MKIRLSPDGVFPITKSHLIGQDQELKTGLEVAGTLQGEGSLAGVPSLFIRLSGCNLRCSWKMPDGTIDICDTPYASHNVEKVIEVEVSEVLETVKANIGKLRHVVVTGGEPTLQPKALTELTYALRNMGLHVTVETNGTKFDESFAKNINLFSISPKLSSSNPMGVRYNVAFLMHSSNRVAIKSISSYIEFCSNFGLSYQLKFVVTGPDDIVEIKGLLKLLGISTEEHIYLMPLGSNQEVLAKSRLFTVEAAISNGWRFSPRLHVDIFGNTSGT